VAEPYGLSFLPLQAEQYDFVIPRARAGRAAVDAFRDVLHDPATRERLQAIGFDVAR
jgi:putative molybdopterin biosynthesis protein